MNYALLFLTLMIFSHLSYGGAACAQASWSVFNNTTLTVLGKKTNNILPELNFK